MKKRQSINRKGRGASQKAKSRDNASQKEKTVGKYLKKLFALLFKYFRESFFFALIKACLLFAFLILILFLIRPKLAHIYMNIEKAGQLRQTEDYHVTAKSVNIYGSGNERRAYTARSEIVIDAPYEIDGVRYSEGFIIARPAASSPLNDSTIILEGEYDNMTLKEDVDLDISVEGETEAFAKNITIRGSGLFRLGTYDTEVYIENEKDPTQNRIIDCYQEQVFIGYENSEFGISLSARNSSERVFTSFTCDSIRASQVEKFTAAVTGKATISYTPTSNEYSLNSQEVVVENTSEKDLRLWLNAKSFEGEIAGYFTDGTISLFSVFPTFQSWFFSVGLLAPTTLITLILSAISIFLKSKKEEKQS